MYLGYCAAEPLPSTRLCLLGAFAASDERACYLPINIISAIALLLFFLNPTILCNQRRCSYHCAAAHDTSILTCTLPCRFQAKFLLTRCIFLRICSMAKSTISAVSPMLDGCLQVILTQYHSSTCRSHHDIKTSPPNSVHQTCGTGCSFVLRPSLIFVNDI